VHNAGKRKGDYGSRATRKRMRGEFVPVSNGGTSIRVKLRVMMVFIGHAPYLASRRDTLREPEFSRRIYSLFIVVLELLHRQMSLFTTGVIPPSMRGNSS
jgi:hypothetical protein